MSPPLSIPSHDQLQKISRERLYKYTNDLISSWHDAQLMAGVNRMCEATHRHPGAELQFFDRNFSKNGMVPICRGYKKGPNGTKIKCDRKCVNGTNFCGYHKGQEEIVVNTSENRRLAQMQAHRMNFMNDYKQTTDIPDIPDSPIPTELEI